VPLLCGVVLTPAAHASTVQVAAVGGQPASDIAGGYYCNGGAAGSGGGEYQSAVAVPRAGRITAFQTQPLAISNGGATVRFNVLRRLGGNQFTVVGTTEPVTFAGDGATHEFAADIAVAAGDVLAFWTNNFWDGCFRSGGSESSAFVSGPPAPGDVVTLTNTAAVTLNEAATLEVNDTLDSYSVHKAVAPVFTSDNALSSGQTYQVSVQGTYSAYNAALMAPGQRGWTMCGTPIDAPLFPTPGVTNGRVGQDPAFIFATPEPGRGCPAKDLRARRRALLAFSTDGGTTWLTPTADGAPSTPTTDHTYTYTVTGAGQPLKIKIVDSNYADNYGRLTIDIANATAA
jgi:hypothetical protein